MSEQPSVPAVVVRGSRAGVRRNELRQYRRLGRVSGVLYTGIGLNFLLLWSAAADLMDRPGPYLVTGFLLILVGVGLIVMTYAVSDDRFEDIYLVAALGGLFGGALVTALALYFIGFAEFGFGAIGYLIVLAFGFYILVRTVALLLMAFIGVAHAILLAASPDVAAPAAGWVWLVTVMLAAAALLGTMVQEIEDAEHDGRTARQDLADLNGQLEVTVARQVAELEQLGTLRRFLPAPVADALLASGDEDVLTAHRREIAVIFCDLRGFTAFASHVEPEEIITVLDTYYRAVGAHLTRFQATVGGFEGDGMMAYLNDPYLCDDPAHRMVEMASAIAGTLDDLTADWQHQGYDLGYGIGIAMGHATLGLVGYDGRSDYTALGNVVNLAARLCSVATRGQIVVDRRIQLQTESSVHLTSLPAISLKGFDQPVPVFEVPRA